jgi:hypothetical protein
MKYIFIAITAFALGYLVGNIFSCGNKDIASKKTELTQGISDTSYTKGDSVLIITEKKYSGRVSSILNPSDGSLQREPEEGTIRQPFSFDEEDYKLDIVVEVDGSERTKIDLEYFLTIKSKEIYRVDTLKIYRVDTLKTIILEPRAFYDSFEVGFTTASVILTAILLIFK